MTTQPDKPVEEQPVNEEVTGSAKKTAAKKAKKPTARKRKATATKRKPAATKKRAASKPSEPVVPTVEEIKEQFTEAAVEPTKKAIDTWQEIAGVARAGFGDLKEAGLGILGGFLGNKKKED